MGYIASQAQTAVVTSLGVTLVHSGAVCATQPTQDRGATVKLALRDYQLEALGALAEGWQDGGQRLAVVLPTGAGKTVIFANLADQWAHRGHRVLILVHRDELAQQTLAKLRATNDALSVGMVKAEHNDVGAQVIVASIQTVQRDHRLRQLGRFALIVCDEAHRSASDGWLKVLQALGAFDSASGVKVAGFTATMSRADKRGLGDVWERVVYSRGIRYFIDRGFLVRPSGLAVGVPDLSGAKRTAGDYNEAELGVRMSTETMRSAIVQGYLEHAFDRQGVLFAPTVDAAQFFAEGLRAAGIATEGVYGTTPLPERAVIYDRLRRGDVQVLTTCTALAEGWDEPQVSCAVLARPTLHAGLYIQQIGRVLRPWPGKSSALVLDAAGASAKHSLEALIELHETPPPVDKTDDELLEELDEQAERMPAWRYTGPTEFVDIDLWAGTGARWLTTTGGVLFVSVGKELVFLLPQGSTWSVGRCSQYSLVGGGWLKEGLSADQALAWASEWAVQQDPSLAGAKAPWRRKQPPSEAQRNYAASLGIDVTGRTKAEVSDMISVRIASTTLRTIGNGQ